MRNVPKMVSHNEDVSKGAWVHKCHMRTYITSMKRNKLETCKLHSQSTYITESCNALTRKTDYCFSFGAQPVGKLRRAIRT